MQTRRKKQTLTRPQWVLLEKALEQAVRPLWPEGDPRHGWRVLMAHQQQPARRLFQLGLVELREEYGDIYAVRITERGCGRVQSRYT